MRPGLNQFGGEKGVGADHFLISSWTEVTSILEDNRSGAVLTTIDFSKAFNRLSHAACLQTFATKGAPNQILALLGSFLSGRSMAVRLGQTISKFRPINAGAPQGSVLGSYLFNIGTVSYTHLTLPTTPYV